MKSPFSKVYVQPPTLGACDLFRKTGHTLVSPEEAEAIVFCGGADIDPAFYGQRPINGTYTNPDRDKRERELWEKFNGKKPMIGICRGAQLLNAFAGGSMWQDVNNHGGLHPVYILKDGKWTGVTKVVNSVHHQMMVPASSGIVMAVAFESTYRRQERNGREFQLDVKRQPHHQQEYAKALELPEPEVIFYPNEQYYCMQSHPEFGHRGTTELFFEHLNEVF